MMNNEKQKREAWQQYQNQVRISGKLERDARLKLVDDALIDAATKFGAFDPVGLVTLIPRDRIATKDRIVSGVEETVKQFKRDRPHFFESTRHHI